MRCEFFLLLVACNFRLDVMCKMRMLAMRVDVVGALQSASLLAMRNVLRRMHVALRAALEQDF
jgi:hypothetical protein